MQWSVDSRSLHVLLDIKGSLVVRRQGIYRPVCRTAAVLVQSAAALAICIRCLVRGALPQVQCRPRDSVAAGNAATAHTIARQALGERTRGGELCR